jgi:catechol 2,3-dioxygenase-like lactoylglutathione lyase family enzyme
MVLHHIGVVVDSLAEAIPLFRVWLHVTPVGEIVEDRTQFARVQLCIMDENTLLELVEPLPGYEEAFHKVGDFHLCFTVPDLDAEMSRLHALGAVVIHRTEASPLFDQRRLSVLATHSGQLLELLEEQAPVQ